MRFHFGAIPHSPDFIPDASWKSLREPSSKLAQFIALPIGLVVTALLAKLWFVLTPLQKLIPSMELLTLLLLMVGLIVVHELIHAITHPMAGRSPRSILGFWPSHMLFYAHYDGEITRNRFVAIMLMPFLIISLAPLFISAIFQFPFSWSAFIACFNALLACMDLLGAGMVLFQIPRTAIVRNQGWRTYWKNAE